MPRYSEEFKEQVVRKMMAPNAQSVAQVHRETGISEPTLYAWRNRYRAEGQVVPADPSNPENWSGDVSFPVKWTPQKLAHWLFPKPRRVLTHQDRHGLFLRCTQASSSR